MKKIQKISTIILCLTMLFVSVTSVTSYAVSVKSNEKTITVSQEKNTISKNLKQNYKKLKAYINKYGTKDKSGNKFVEYKYNQYTARIYLKKSSQDMLKFEVSSLKNSKNSQKVTENISVNVNPLKSSYVKPVYTIIKNNSTSSVINGEATAKVKMSKITAKDSINFQTNSCNIYTKDQIEAFAESYFKTSMNMWNIILHNKLGLTLKDVGFKSYENKDFSFIVCKNDFRV